MNKKQVIKWLEGKRNEALNNAGQQYMCDLEHHRETLYEEIELKSTVQEIEEYLQRAYESYQNWKNKYDNNTDIKIVSHYGGIGRFLEDTLVSKNKVLSRMMLYDVEDISEEFSRISTLYHDTKEEIKKNYTNLIANVRSLNVVSACEYLNQLGFDTSDIAMDKSVCIDLRDNVETKYLFVKGTEEKTA